MGPFQGVQDLENSIGIAVQCNLGDEKWQLKYNKLKARYDEVESVLFALREELTAVKRIAGLDNSDEDSDSEESLQYRIRTGEGDHFYSDDEENSVSESLNAD